MTRALRPSCRLLALEMSEVEYRPVENFNPGHQDNAAWANAGGARPVPPARPPIVPQSQAVASSDSDSKKDQAADKRQ